MATRLLIVRHGQSQANLEHRIAGHSNFPLTDLGRTQAQMTADFLKDEHIDVLLSSDLDRAYETALPIGASHGLEVEKRTSLREIFCGDWEGMPVELRMEKYPEERRIWIEDFVNAVCPNGESTRQMIVRAAAALDGLTKEFPNHTVCIATHGAFARALGCVMYGEGDEKISKMEFPSNASVTEGIFENGAWRVVRFSYDAHLGDLATFVTDGNKQ